MDSPVVIAVIAGLAAGIAAAVVFMLVYSSRQRRSATGVLAAARADAERLRSDAARAADALRSEAVIGAKSQALALRDEGERVLQGRRAGVERRGRSNGAAGTTHEREI